MVLGSNELDYSWNTGDTTLCIEITEANNYSLSVTNEFNCSSSDSIFILFNDLSIANIMESNCQLMALQSVGLTYTWILDSVIIPNANQLNYTPMENGVYHLIVTDTNGCSDIDSILVNCFVNNS